MGIGENIKEKRKQNRLTQKQLAEILGVSTITIQNYENNRRTPNIVMINSIADALGVSQHELMTGESLFNGTRGIYEKLQESINFGIDQTTNCRMDKIIILRQYIKRLAQDRNIILSSDELSEIVYFLSPVIDPLLDHKLNEILEKHKKEALLLNDGVKLAKSKLSKKDLSYIENLSPEEQSEFLDRANELANKIINERNKEK